MDEKVERVELMMMPVCSCGYVFDDLTLTVETEPLHAGQDNYLVLKTMIFNPSRCPKCGRIIKCVRARDLNKSLSNIMFISKEDKPFSL